MEGMTNMVPDDSGHCKQKAGGEIRLAVWNEQMRRKSVKENRTGQDEIGMPRDRTVQDKMEQDYLY